MPRTVTSTRATKHLNSTSLTQKTRPNPSRLIRHARLKDLAYVYALQNRLHDHVGYTPRGALDERIRTHRMLIVEENGDPAGYVTYTHRRDRRTHLPQVAVDPAIWRTLAGSELMQRLITSATRAGSYALTLKSAIDLDVNHFWPRHGFTPQHVEQTRTRSLVHWARKLVPMGTRPILAPKSARPLAGIIARTPAGRS